MLHRHASIESLYKSCIYKVLVQQRLELHHERDETQSRMLWTNAGRKKSNAWNSAKMRLTSSMPSTHFVSCSYHFGTSNDFAKFQWWLATNVAGSSCWLFLPLRWQKCCLVTPVSLQKKKNNRFQYKNIQEPWTCQLASSESIWHIRKVILRILLAYCYPPREHVPQT